MLNNELIWASGNGHIEVVRELIRAGANVHARDDYALRYASKYGHIEVVRELLRAGADVHACDDYALRWASYHGHIEVVQLLKNPVSRFDKRVHSRFFTTVNNLYKFCFTKCISRITNSFKTYAKFFRNKA